MDWRIQGEEKAQEAGFSSLQDAVRLWIKQFVDGLAGFQAVAIRSDLAEEEKILLNDKKYLADIKKARADVKAGRVIDWEDLKKELDL
jgi:hypothetical protein